MNGHSEGREGDKELSDIVGADNTLPPYSASTRGMLRITIGSMWHFIINCMSRIMTTCTFDDLNLKLLF